MQGLLMKYYFLFFSHYFGYNPGAYLSQFTFDKGYIAADAACINDSSFYFRNPLNIPLHLVGGFGEIRKNHLHAGLDIKTNEREGLAVFAVADGYISRIKISSGGYGKAVYITHPNGITSVYGHLQSLYGDFEQLVLNKHYAAQSFELDVYLMPDEAPVKKGEQFAISGNTGGSTGPHLHFELRDAYTEAILNPQLFGFKLDDDEAPVIKQLAIYSWDKMREHPYLLMVKARSELSDANGERVYFCEPIVVNDPHVKLSVQAYDVSDKSGSTQGLFHVQLFREQTVVYEHQMKSFEFSQTRYANTFADYYLNTGKEGNWQHLYVSANNQLPIYTATPSKGIINLNTNETAQFQLLAQDVYGNRAVFNFEMRYEPLPEEEPLNGNYIMIVNQRKVIKGHGILMDFAANSLYESLDFTYDYNAGAYQIANAKTPLQKAFKLQLQVSKPELLNNLKTVLVCESKENGKSVYTGKWVANSFVCQVKEFGKVYLQKDTSAPVISAAKAKGRFKINDNLSGIATYRVTVDGVWQLAELDGKSGTLVLKPNAKLEKGQHSVVITVSDRVGNTSTKQFKLIT